MSPPPILYKYFSTSRISFFESPTLRFSPPADLNDPFEGKPNTKGLGSPERLMRDMMSLFEREYDELLKQIPPSLRGRISRDKVKKSIQSLAVEKAPLLCSLEAKNALQKSIEDAAEKRGLGILCLSEVKDNILMWSHYGQDHKGFVIGFDALHPFFDRRTKLKEAAWYLQPVTYQEKRPSKYMVDYLSGGELARDFYFTKGIEWQYEAEWRMLAEGIQYIVGNGKTGVDVVPIEVIKEIYVGVKSDSLLKDSAITFASHCGIKDIYQMTFDDSEEYRLKPISI